MTTIRNAKVRVIDCTEPQPIKRKETLTVTQSGVLYHVLRSGEGREREEPRFRKPGLEA